MTSDPVTLTLPFLTWQGLNVLLTALGITIATGLMWLMLNGAGRQRPATLESWAKAGAWVLALVWLWLLGATLWGLWQVFGGVKDAPLAGGSLGLGALIAAFLGAPFVIYGTWLRHKTNRLEQEGHMTDRINKAVEQLGADKIVKRDGVEESVPNIEVRMGAILSLERIAQDSTTNDKGRDHVRVMEILCAYIRENARASDAKKSLRRIFEEEAEDPGAPQGIFVERFCEEHKISPPELGDAISVEATNRWAQTLAKPRADVQLTLTVIGRRNVQQRIVEAAWPHAPSGDTVWPFDSKLKRLPDDPTEADLDAFEEQLAEWRSRMHDYRGYRLDLRNANLQGADMAAKNPDGSDAEYSGALFNGSCMEGVNLKLARLRGVDLVKVPLDGAFLWLSKLEAAEMLKVRMEGAILFSAKLHGATLALAKMEGARMHEAQLQGANLRFANLKNADLAGAKLEGARMQRARLEYVNLSGVELDGYTALEDALLNGAGLQRVDCSSAPISDKQINSTFGDASVILPANISRPAHWPDWELPLSGKYDFHTEWRKWQSNPDVYSPPKKPD